jgi:hypothetical protein
MVGGGHTDSGPLWYLCLQDNEARFVPVDQRLHWSQGLGRPASPAPERAVNSVDGVFLSGDGSSAQGPLRGELRLEAPIELIVAEILGWQSEIDGRRPE